MDEGPAEILLRLAAEDLAGDLDVVALHHGMSLSEFETLVGKLRGRVEDGIRAARVRLMARLERKGGE